MAGLDANGLTIKRLPEIVSDIEVAEQTNINPDISVSSDTLVGQLNNIMASALSDVWSLIEVVNDNFNVDKAEGKNLDDLAALRKVSRIEASASYTDRQSIVATNGTQIAAGSLFSNPITGDRFTNPVEVIVDAGSCISCKMDVVDVLDSTAYTVGVNGVEYIYTSDGSATASEIVNGIDALITADLNITWSSVVAGDSLIITSDNDTPISIVLITYIVPTEVTVLTGIIAVTDGPIVAPPNSVNTLVTIVSGVSSTVNLDQLILGGLEESDENLRVRIKTATSFTSTGTIPSIEDALLNNISGVSSAIVTENVTAVTDLEGIPPHAYETVVVGGVNEDVAKEIWRTKPAGIRLHGNTLVTILDSNSNSRDIRFTRPVSINIAVRVRYTLYDEEAYPAGGDALIKTAVVDSINGLGLGVDVIAGRLFGTIYGAAEGMDSLVVEIQEIPSAGDTPVELDWQTTKLPIATSEFANITTNDVYVEDVTP